MHPARPHLFFAWRRGYQFGTHPTHLHKNSTVKSPTFEHTCSSRRKTSAPASSGESVGWLSPAPAQRGPAASICAQSHVDLSVSFRNLCLGFKSLVSRSILESTLRTQCAAFFSKNANGVNTCSSKPRITIHTDSTFAILRSVGPTTRKRRHRDVTRMIREALAHARAVLGAGNVLIDPQSPRSQWTRRKRHRRRARDRRSCWTGAPQRLTVPQSQSGIPDLNETDEEGAHGLHTACWLRNRCKRTKTRPSATLVYPARVRIPAW